MLLRKNFGDHVRLDVQKSGLFGKKAPVHVQGTLTAINAGVFGLAAADGTLVSIGQKSSPRITRVYHHPHDISVPACRIIDNASRVNGYAIDNQGITFDCA